MNQEESGRRACALPGCEITFLLTLAAPHKKFCCAEHKNMFHTNELRDARRRLRQEREEKKK